MSILKKLVVISVSSVLYYASLWLNDLIWGETEFSFDVHWVFFSKWHSFHFGIVGA